MQRSRWTRCSFRALIISPRLSDQSTRWLDLSNSWFEPNLTHTACCRGDGQSIMSIWFKACPYSTPVFSDEVDMDELRTSSTQQRNLSAQPEQLLYPVANSEYAASLDLLLNSEAEDLCYFLAKDAGCKVRKKFADDSWSTRLTDAHSAHDSCSRNAAMNYRDVVG